MVRPFIVAVGFAVLGDAVANMLATPVPGAAIGMMLLAMVFAVRGKADVASARLFNLASPHFPLFLIPAAVGVVNTADLMAVAWLHVAVAIVVGTSATIAVTGVLGQLLLGRPGSVRSA